MAGDFQELENILAYFEGAAEAHNQRLLGPALSEAEINAFEAKYSFPIPYILRAFYLAHNGMGDDVSRGSPHQHIVPIQSLGEVAGNSRTTLYNHADETKDQRKLKKSEKDLLEPDPPDAFFPIGMDASGDIYFLDLRRRSRQGIPVLLLHHDAPFEVDNVADSVEAFVLDFLTKELGEQPGQIPSLPSLKSQKKDARSLVREAIPRPRHKPEEPEGVPDRVTARVLSQIGSTNWRHSSSPEGEMGGILCGCFTLSGQLVTLGRDAHIHVWSMADGSVERSMIIMGSEPERIVLSPDETWLAVHWHEEYDSKTVIVVILNFADGSERCRFTVDGLRELQCSKDSSQCISLTEAGVIFHDAATGKQERKISLKKEPSRHLAVSDDGKRLVTDTDGEFPLWVRDDTGKKIREIEGPADTKVRHIAFGPAGISQLCVAADALLIHDLDNAGQTTHPLPFEDYEAKWADRSLLSCVQYRYNKKYSRVGFDIALVKMASGELISKQSFDHDWGNVFACVSPDQKRAAVCYEHDLRCHLHSLPSFAIENPQSDSVSDAALEGVTGSGLALLSRDTVRATDTAGRLLASRTIPGDSISLFCAAASGDGSMVAVTDTNCRVHVLSFPALEPLADIKVPSYAKAAAFGPEGTTLLIGCDDGALLLHDAAQKKTTKLPQWMEGYTSQITWSPDGKLALAADGATAILFDPAKRKLVNDRISQGEFTWAVDFSVDGSWILVAGRDVSLRVLDLSGKEILRVPDVDVMRAWFMHDGRILIFQMDGSLLFLGWDGKRAGEFNLKDTYDCLTSVVPSRDRREWHLKSSRGRLMRCEF